MKSVTRFLRADCFVGRAGNKGTAYTFICEEEEKFSPDLVKALQESKAPVPRDLMQLAENFNGKRDRGEVQARGSGYGGSGFKFDVGEEEARNAERRVSFLIMIRHANAKCASAILLVLVDM